MNPDPSELQRLVERLRARSERHERLAMTAWQTDDSSGRAVETTYASLFREAADAIDRLSALFPEDLREKIADVLARLPVRAEPSGCELDRLRRLEAADAIIALLTPRGDVNTLPSPDDLNAMDRIGQAALDVALPVLKAHWAGNTSASMNPALDYLAVNMGIAVIAALREGTTEDSV